LRPRALPQVRLGEQDKGCTRALLGHITPQVDAWLDAGDRGSAVQRLS